MFSVLRSHRFPVWALLPWLVVLPPAGAEKATPTAQAAFTPVHAEMVGPMEARLLKPGSPLLLKVKTAWQNDDCKLREGAILKGHVVDANVSSKSEKISKVAVTFDEAECNGREMVAMPLALAAVIAPDPAEVTGLQKYAPLTDGPVAMGTGGNGMRSLANAAFNAENSAMPVELPRRIAPGQVIGLSGIKLSVGTGPESSSVLSRSGRNVTLERYTQFMLIPGAMVARARPAAAAGGATNEAPAGHPALSSRENVTAAPAPKPAEPDVEVCAPPSCNMVLSTADTTVEQHATASFSLAQLGYAPRYGVEMEQFDHEAAVAYLGRNQLLVTFNPHTLIHRGDVGEESVRIVRAVLLQLPSMHVIRTVDWHVPDHRQYLWAAGEDRVLAHVGNELRVYGPDLKVEQRIDLHGPLAWVRVAPAKKNFAIGVLMERHSRELHAQLLSDSGVEPEEDVEVRILDANFETLVSAIRSSRYVPPVLTDDGEVGVYQQANNRWHLVEHTWDRRTRSIARVNSTCMPQISSMESGLLFVMSCNRNSGMEYRVLRPDGKPLLQGFSPSEELGQSARGSDPGEVFVVSVAEADRSLIGGGVFHPSDLKDGRFTVYRASDGRRVFSARVESPAPTDEAYALAPGGGELAVLCGEQISLYTVRP